MQRHPAPAERLFRRVLLATGPGFWTALTFLLTVFDGASRAHADPVSYSTTLSIVPTDWTNSVSLPKFDPSLGTLQKVSWILDYTFRSTARLENLDPVPRPGVVHGANETLNVKLLTSTVIAASGSVRFTNNFGAYDGAADFAGTSGVSLTRRTVSGAVSNIVTGSLATYIGIDRLPLLVTAKGVGFATGLNTFLQQVRPEAGLTLIVRYEYVPVSIGATIGDRVWRDDNGNGVQDPNEPGIAGVPMTLLDASGTTVLATATTDASGLYGFGGLAAGTYTVAATQPAHHVPTFDLDGLTTPNRAVVVVAAGQIRTDVDFGYLPLSSIGGLVWLDLDRNGVPDPSGSEPGLAGVPVTVSGTGGTFATVTDGLGKYLIPDLLPGTYTIAVTAPAGLVPTFDVDGIGTPNVARIVLPAGSNRLDINFGYGIGSNLSDARLGGLVWLDLNGNGLLDVGEPGRTNVPMALLDATGVTVLTTTTTDATGHYLFGGLPGGTYTVVVTPGAGFVETFNIAGLASTNRATVTLANAEHRLNVDFGYRHCSRADGDHQNDWNHPFEGQEYHSDPDSDGLDADDPCDQDVDLAQDRGESSDEGCTANYWRDDRSQKTCGPDDFSELSSLRLCNDDGSDRDFSKSLPGNRLTCSTWLKSTSTANMSRALSVQLACLELNVLHNKCRSTTVFTTPGFNDGTMTAAQLIGAADDALTSSTYTPAGNPDRAYQDHLRSAIKRANNSCVR